MSKIISVFTGTGSCIPTKQVKNSFFHSHEFYDSTGEKITTPGEEIARKFEEITTISERRYAEDHQSTTDLALFASEQAIESSGINKEELDYIIVAHNFGETEAGNSRISLVPALASRLKARLGIENPSAIAYDIIFGCPGWVQAVIQADYYIRAGDAKKVLVVGADVLSRVADPHDRDSMIYADGAGAVVIEAKESDTPIGILGHIARSDAVDYVNMLQMGDSFHPEVAKTKDYYLKMNGRRLYQYALDNVPKAIKAGLDKLNIGIDAIKKVLIHQANGKMDDAILARLYKLFGKDEMPVDVMPMTISWLGNSSVATVPTLLDLIMRNKMPGQALHSGDTIVLASVGAGMNINSIVYRLP